MQVHDVGLVPDGVELLQPDDQDDHLLAEVLGDRGDDGHLHGLRLRLLPLLVDGEGNAANIWSPWIISYHVRLGRTTTVATEIPAGTNVGCGIDPMRRSSLHHDLDSRMFYDLNLQIKIKRIITPVLY